MQEGGPTVTVRHHEADPNRTKQRRAGDVLAVERHETLAGTTHLLLV